ncbi:MAG: hypothetical protein ACLSA1_03685, partial [Alphaproteobacteria bacterium]
MIEFVRKLDTINNLLSKKDIVSIKSNLTNPALEYEFYNSIIEKNVEWFDILKQNNVFDYHSFLV